MDIRQWMIIIPILVYNIKRFECSEMQLESSSVVEVVVGMDAGLTCNYPETIQPPFSVYWVFDGQPIIRCGTKCTRNATDKYILTIDKQLRNVRLTVQDTNLKDHGNYSCFLTTGSVTGRRVITLLVRENPAYPTITDIDLGHRYNNYAIVQAIFGTERQFTCTGDIEFESLFRLRWMTTCLSRGNYSRFTSNLTQSNTRNRNKDVVIDFEKENYGVSLTCEVLWKDGNSLNISTTVDFNTRASLEYVILTSDVKDDGYKNQEVVPVIAGVTVEFSCFPNEFTPVRRPVWVTWKTFIEGDQICQQGNIRLESPELCTNTTSANVIFEENDQDKMLTCEIYNREKDIIANRSIIIDVIDPPSIRTNIPNNTHLVEGLRNISLVCSPSKKQWKYWNTSDVHWNGSTSYLEQFWSNEAGGQVLRFSEVQRNQSGRYICTVSLSIGILEADKDLTVHYSPIIQACLTKNISDGRITTISCVIAAYPMPSIDWTDAAGNVIKKSVYINMSLTVGDMIQFQLNMVNSSIFISFDLPNVEDLNTVTFVVSNVLGSTNRSFVLPWLQDVGGTNSRDEWVVICAVVLPVIFVMLITISGLLLRKKKGCLSVAGETSSTNDRRALPAIPSREQTLHTWTYSKGATTSVEPSNQDPPITDPILMEIFLARLQRLNQVTMQKAIEEIIETRHQRDILHSRPQDCTGELQYDIIQDTDESVMQKEYHNPELLDCDASDLEEMASCQYSSPYEQDVDVKKALKRLPDDRGNSIKHQKYIPMQIIRGEGKEEGRIVKRWSSSLENPVGRNAKERYILDAKPPSPEDDYLVPS